MAATCPNCKTRLSCGCQNRRASNGTAVCSNCISKYETSLKIANQSGKQTGNSPTPK
jgi:hypothetical protein